jgi:hypothetical protein
LTNVRLLKIYLNDHLATLTAGIELTKRSGSSNRGTPLGKFLAELQSEFETDRDALLEVLSLLDLSSDPLKRTAGWLVEKAGRLKFNGRLVGYSDLSRLIELEGLAAIVMANAALWRSLGVIAPAWSQLARFDFEAMAQNAERQRVRLEEFRSTAAAVALAGSSSGE